MLIEDLDRAATLDHTLPMLASSHGRGMVSFIAVCVVLLFFFPLVQGPFQATHGPTTAFRARMAFLILIFSILRGALGVLSPFCKAMAKLSGIGFPARTPIPIVRISIPQPAALRC